MFGLDDVFKDGFKPKLLEAIRAKVDCDHEETETTKPKYIKVGKCNEDYAPYNPANYPIERGGTNENG